MKKILNTLIASSGLNDKQFATEVGVNAHYIARLKMAKNLNLKLIREWMRIVKVEEIKVNIYENTLLIIKQN